MAEVEPWSVGARVALLALAIVLAFAALVPSALAEGAANLDQCENGPLSAPVPCTFAGGNNPWVNGNLNGNKAHYLEDQVVPFRMVMTGLTVGKTTNTVTVEWDSIKNGKHAYDFITNFRSTETTADPCVQVTGCNVNAPNWFAIPRDPSVPAAYYDNQPLISNPESIAMYGGVITNITVPTLAAGSDAPRRVTVTFTSNSSTVVMAWGGHIADHHDWGNGQAAANISGSPYHMRLVELNGGGGNQDRSISSDAIIFPASIKIIKNADPDSDRDFAFSTTGGLVPAGFTLDDDADPTLPNEQFYTGLTNFSTYSVTEGLANDWSLDPTNPVTCSVAAAGDVNANQSFDPATRTLTIPLDEGEDITCTFLNKRDKGKLEVVKDLAPVGDPGKFNLLVDGVVKATDIGDGGTSTEQTVDAGVHSVSETQGTGTLLTNYAKSVSCIDTAPTPDVAVTTAANGTANWNVTVTKGSDIVCTITNTRSTAQLEVQKIKDPAGVPGLFNLFIDATEHATDVGHLGTTGGQNVPTGVHNVKETAGTGTTLSDFTQSITCVNRNAGNAAVTATASGAGWDVDVQSGFDVLCQITNSRKTGQLEVIKNLSPTTAAGFFNLFIDSSQHAMDVGHLGTTGKQTVATGAHTVKETAGSGTSLSDFTQSIACVDIAPNPDAAVPAAADGNGGWTVNVDENDNIECTITNTRRQGELEVVKSLAPTTDTGKFNLLIDGATTASSASVGHNGTTGAVALDTGLHSVNESAASPTTLDDYTQSIDCVDTTPTPDAPVNPTPKAGGGWDVNVTYLSDIVCTITNTRKQGTLKVVKATDPITDTGKFNLLIDGSAPNAGSQDVSHGGHTGDVPINTGVHNVDESAGTGTDLAHYNNAVACVDTAPSPDVSVGTAVNAQGGWDVEVTHLSSIVCTITNTRRQASITVNKAESPTDDPGSFDLKVGSTVVKAGANHGQGGSTSVAPGTYAISEDAANANFPLSKYDRSVSCVKNNAVGPSNANADTVNVTVDSNDVVVCTITNTRRQASITVNKAESPTDDPGSFDLKVGSTVVKAGANHGQGGSTNVAPGTYAISEDAANANFPLSKYDRSVSCVKNSAAGPSNTQSDTVNVTVDSNDVVVCTITNTRRKASITVNKAESPTDDPGSFDLKVGTTVVKAAANHGQGGSTSVAPGTYAISEDAANANFPLSKYTRSVDCVKNNAQGPANPQSDTVNVTVDSNDTVVCTITNTRRAGSITVNKSESPTDDPGSFDLKVGSTVVKAGASHGQGGSVSVGPGTYTVSEDAANANFPLSKYDRSVSCTKNDAAYAANAQSDTINVTLDSNDVVVCTITNTRRQASITVNKSESPTDDPGSFDLKVGSTVVKAGANHGQGGSTNVAPGTYSISEDAANANFPLSKYDRSVSCVKNSAAGPSNTQSDTVNVTVDSNDVVVCTITNTRRAGSITVNKSESPTDDPGSFDLKVGSTVVKAGANHGQGGSLNVGPGTYTVSEDAANANFPLSKYDRSVSCTKNDVAYAANAQSDTVSVTLDSNDVVVCTITNTRRKASITVNKAESPTDDPGSFDLKVGSTVVKAGANHGQGGSTNVAPGTYSISEDAANSNFPLSKYDRSVSCVKNSAAGPSNANADTVNVTVDSNDVVVCTITNTRRKASITVNKAESPTDDPGSFDLKVGSTVVKAAANHGQGGSTNVAPGTYAISEDAANSNFPLSKYDRSVSCVKNSAAGPSNANADTVNVTVDSNDVVVCTITNTRRKASITVVKDLVPSNDAGLFDLKVGSTVVKANATNGSSGSIDVAPGAYVVSEAAAAGGDLADYDRSVACVKNGQAGPADADDDSVSVTVDSNDAVTCTITNVRLGKIEIEKQTDPDETNGPTFAFTTTANLGSGFSLADDGVETIARVLPNSGQGGATYTVTEATKTGYRLSAIDCKDGDSTEALADRKATVIVSPGETVRCVFTNLKLASSHLVVKEGTLISHHGDPLNYTFAVTNTGNSPLHDVEVTDDKCAPVSSTPIKTNDDGDNLLEREGSPDATQPEVWTYTCTYLAPAHADGEANPIRNTVTATAKDEQNQPVTPATDDHDTFLLDPQITVDKTLRRQGSATYVQGPIEAHVGDVVEYQFAVTTAGNTPLTVTLEDAKCGAKTGPSGDTDADGKLDNGETWIYTCAHTLTAQDPDPYDNTVKVTGVDAIGGDKGTKTSTDTARVDILNPDIELDKKLRRGDSGPFVDGPIDAHVGDTLEYQFTVTNPGDAVLTVIFSDSKCDPNTLTPVTGDADSDGKLDPGETWVSTCKHLVQDSDGSSFENVATVEGTDPLGGKDSDTDRATANIINPSTLVVKEGNTSAYHGDTVTYTFTVTNTGNTPLSGVKVSDDKCPNVPALPTTKTNDDGDALLDPIGVDGVNHEVWVFTCSMPVPDHADGEINPIRNVATATGTDVLGRVVTGTDDHLTTILHPAIGLDKVGPASAEAGSRIPYELVVTNGGDVPLAGETVAVTDPECEAPPTLLSKGRDGGADPTPTTLDPGDTWVYACTVQTQAGQTQVTNVGTVKALDVNGRAVSATDTVPTSLTSPPVQVLPAAVISGAARLTGPSGCVSRAFTARVTGRRIASAVFTIDGRAVKRFNDSTGEATKVSFRVKPSKYGRGTHKLVVKITYHASAKTPARTLRMTFARCARRVARPQFTG